ncbi:MAG: phage holin family protein [Pirellulales bacterium]|nr:phage holin family protein [Pirellulales bacterium]
MADNERPLLYGLQAELGSLASDIREMAELRWKLAKLELTADVHTTVRLVVILLVAVLLTLIALPVLVVSLGSLLDGTWGLSQSGWLLIFGLTFLATAGLGGFLGWRRFRRNFIGLEETLEELHEDMIWLREWRESAKTTDDVTND